MSSLFRRFWPAGKRRESVELGPVEQLALRFLLRSGPGAMDTIYKEVESVRLVSHAEVGAALTTLVSDRLIESRFQLVGDKGETLYVPTRRGERLRDRIPPEPKSVIELWL